MINELPDYRKKLVKNVLNGHAYQINLCKQHGFYIREGYFFYYFDGDFNIVGHNGIDLFFMKDGVNIDTILRINYV